jgi:hypothetical protein
VIATLPHATASLDLNTYMAVHEKELDDEALNAPPDEVKLVRENRIAAQLAQAMGRIRLRTMTKPDGTCEPCDIFLRLPNWRYMIDADRILDAVKRTLPGAQVLPWERATRKLKRDGRTPRTRTGVVARLLTLADRVVADGVARQVTRETVKASNGTLGRVLGDAKTGGRQLYRDLAARGVRLVPGAYGAGGGRSGRNPARLVLAQHRAARPEQPAAGKLIPRTPPWQPPL